jgi:hypothetical protein
MLSSRIPYRPGVLFCILVGMVTVKASACYPSLDVCLDGHDPEWTFTGCPVGADATATGGTVSDWRYYIWPGGTCDDCDFFENFAMPCGDPPPRSCPVGSPGTYHLYVDVCERDPFTWEITDSDTASKTIYAVGLGLLAQKTVLAVGGTRGHVIIDVVPAGPTEDCYVQLGLWGATPFAAVYNAPTGGDLLFQGGQSMLWPAAAPPEEVWVEGINASDFPGCILSIQYVDPYGRTHPECTDVSVHFKIYEVHFHAVSAGNVPDLPPGRICVNAQSQYKRARYRVTQVLPDGTARVAVAPGSSVTDITFEGINGANVNALVSGDEFWAVGDEQVGSYLLKLTHNDCAEAQETQGDSAFKFCIYRGDTIPFLEAKIASYGTYETWAYKDGHYVNYGQGQQASNVKSVYIFTEGGDYEGNVRVNARAVATGTVEGEIRRVDAFGDIAGSISVSMGAFTATLNVPGQQDGATAGGGVVLQIGALGADVAVTQTGQTEVQAFGAYATYKQLDPNPADVDTEISWARTFSLPNGPHLVIGIGAAAGASGNPAYKCKGRARTSNVQVNVVGGTYEIVP